MTIYLISYWFIAFQEYVIQNKKKIAWACGTLLFFIMAVRSDSLGVDLVEGYQPIFLYLSGISLKELVASLQWIRIMEVVTQFRGALFTIKMEPGYLIMNWVIAQLGLSFHSFLVICALVNIISFSVFFYRYSDDVAMSFLMFCSFGTYLYCFGILRHMLAVSILLWSIPYIEKNKTWKALLIIIIAFFFHRTAIVALPLVVAGRLKMTKTIFLGSIFGMIFMAIAFPMLIKNVLSYIFAYFNKAIIVSGGGFTTLDYLLMIVIIYVLVVHRFDREISNRDSLLLWSLIFLMFLRIICSIETSIGRSEVIYFTMCYALIPNLISKWNGVNRRILQTGMIVFLFVYFIKNLWFSPEVPYIAMWNI